MTIAYNPHEINLLLVDDTPSSLKTLMSLLMESGYQVRPAVNGELALKAASLRPPDLIMLDIRMPEMDGFEVCRRLKENERTREIPVIFISALGEVEDKVRAFEYGGVDYITKPFQLKEVMARVETHLSLRCLQKSLKESNDRLRHEIENRKRIEEQLQEQITNKNRVVKDLEKNQNFLKAVLDCIEDGIVACDQEGKLTLFNRATRIFHGLPAEPLHSEKWAEHYDLYLPDGKTLMQKEDVPLFKALQGEDVTNIEMVIAPEGKPVCTLIATGRTLIDKKGNKLGAVVSMHDITRRKEAEDALKLKEQLLIQQSKMAAMGEMIGAITHQWKQPLNSLSVMAQDIKDAYVYGELNDDYINKRVKNILNQVCFMSQTIDDFRNFFKPDKKMIPFRINSSVKDVILLLYDQFRKIDIDFQLNCTYEGAIKKQPTGKKAEICTCEPELDVMGFQNEFKQAILNILINAKDAIIENRGKGLISIEITMMNGKAVVMIKDNGGGIPHEILDRIFDPYVTSKDKGAGIGLYMSKIIIENSMGGKLYAKNKDKGALFTIELDM